MLTAGDKKWLQDTFATKKELSNLRDSVDLLRDRVTNSSLEKLDMKEEIRSLRAASVRTEEKIDKVLTILDKQSGRLDTLEQETKIGSVTFARHAHHLQVLAKKAGLKLGM